jgi:hypothetical protein
MFARSHAQWFFGQIFAKLDPKKLKEIEKKKKKVYDF